MTSKMQPCLLKKPLKTQKLTKKCAIIKNYDQNAIYILFLGITKVVDLHQKDADGSRTQVICHLVYIFFGPSLDKLCQV